MTIMIKNARRGPANGSLEGPLFTRAHRAVRQFHFHFGFPDIWLLGSRPFDATSYFRLSGRGIARPFAARRRELCHRSDLHVPVLQLPLDGMDLHSEAWRRIGAL